MRNLLQPLSHAELHNFPFVAVHELFSAPRSTLLVHANLTRTAAGSKPAAVKDLVAGLKFAALRSRSDVREFLAVPVSLYDAAGIPEVAAARGSVIHHAKV